MRAFKQLLYSMALAAVCSAAVTQESVQTRLQLDIPPQRMADALNEFARQSGLQVLIDWQVSHELTSPKILGSYTAQEALETLLEESGLDYKYLDTRTVAVLAKKKPPAAAVGDESSLRLSRADTDSTEGSYSAAENLEGLVIEQIVVTAQKRVERLQDVPVPVTAINARTLADVNQVQLQDYYTRVPGLSLTSQGFRNSPVISIRGVTTGEFTNPLVGVVVDDIPYGSTTNLGGGTLVADIDPSELARVEVLRGPQGTLYGAASMGGLLKYVTIDPTTDAMAGRAQVGLSSVKNGDEAGYNIRGTFNMPFSDTFAVRVSAFTRSDPGYIDNTTAGTKGVNSGDARGGRFAALWKPSDAFSIKLGALLQDSETDGSVYNSVAVGFGDLEQALIPGSGWADKKSRVYSATLSAELGRANLVALSGYGVNSFADSIDFSELFGTAVERTEDNETTKFTQEVRLTMPLGARIEWLSGIFYGDEESDYRQFTRLVDGATGEVAALINRAAFPSTFEETAAFTNFIFQVNDRFDVQIGGRQSWNRQTYEHLVELANGEDLLFSPKAIVEDKAFTYLLTPRFRFTPNIMAYARFASGYRPAAFSIFASLAGVPIASDPDKTRNYEIGIKGAFFDQALTFDASVYYIDWNDIQVAIFDIPRQAEYFVNSSRARSEGIELSIEARPRAGLTIGAWLAWNEAELKEALPVPGPVVGNPGDRLPFSSPISGNLSLNQEFPLIENWTAFVGGALSYVDKRDSVFVGAGARQDLNSYTKVDLSAGLRSDSWSANLFINNLTDKRGVLSGGIGTFFPSRFTYIQPRTAGVSVAWNF